MNGLNVVSQLVIHVAIYNWVPDLLYWFRLKPGFNLLEHQNTMLQINMIPHPVTLPAY